jgi:hypothetical protein
MDDTTVAKLQAIKTDNGYANLSAALRGTIEAISGFSAALGDAAHIPENKNVTDPALDTKGLSLDALAAADEASFFNIYMPTPEAMRRLVAALAAARPFMIEEAEAEARSRTIQEIIDRAEGHVGAGDVSQLFIDHLKSIK